MHGKIFLKSFPRFWKIQKIEKNLLSSHLLHPFLAFAHITPYSVLSFLPFTAHHVNLIFFHIYVSTTCPNRALWFVQPNVIFSDFECCVLACVAVQHVKAKETGRRHPRRDYKRANKWLKCTHIWKIFKQTTRVIFYKKLYQVLRNKIFERKNHKQKQRNGNLNVLQRIHHLEQ